MKKAKIILSAVAVFAVVGGAFAFKAARYGEGTLFTAYTTTTTTVGGPLVTLCSATDLVSTNIATLPLVSAYTTVLAKHVCPAPIQTKITTTNPGL